HRLIVEPLPETPPPPVNERDPLSVFNLLVDRHGMTQELFNRLHHQPMRMFGYLGGLRMGRSTEANDHERATFRRFQACLDALQRRASWDDAIIIALHLEPKPEAAVGDGPTAEPTKPTTAVEPSVHSAAIVPNASVYFELDEPPPSEGVEVSWE